MTSYPDPNFRFARLQNFSPNGLAVRGPRLLERSPARPFSASAGTSLADVAEALGFRPHGLVTVAHEPREWPLL